MSNCTIDATQGQAGLWIQYNSAVPSSTVLDHVAVDGSSSYGFYLYSDLYSDQAGSVIDLTSCSATNGQGTGFYLLGSNAQATSNNGNWQLGWHPGVLRSDHDFDVRQQHPLWRLGAGHPDLHRLFDLGQCSVRRQV
jgi:hypothetical protein